MRFKTTAAVTLAAVLVLCSTAAAQYTFSNELPSQKLGSGFFSGVTRGSQFSSQSSGMPTGPLAVQFGVNPAGFGGGYTPTRFDFTDLRKDLRGLRLRSIESFALNRRARFLTLQKVSLDLAGRVGTRNLAGPVDVRHSFYQFIFPFTLKDKPAKFGYGYFTAGCLSRGLIEDPEAFLAEFNEEAQTTISDDTFLAATAAMMTTGKPPAGKSLEGFYDSQLAAMGNYLFSNRRYKTAAEVWQLLAKRDSKSSLYPLAAGQSLFAARQFEAASDELRRSLTLAEGWGTKDFHIAGSNLQNIYAKVDDLAEARALLETQLSQNPDNRKLSFLMAEIDLFHGLRDRAAKRLGELAAKDDAEAKELLAVLTSGRVADSVRRPFASDLTLTAADVAGMNSRVLLTLTERKQLVDSMLHPATSKDYLTLGDFQFFMGNYSQATQAYEKASQLSPENLLIRFAEVHAAFANGEFPLAARRLKEGLAAEPNLGLYNFRVEEFFGNRLDMERRLRDLEHLNTLEPSNLDYKLLLAYIYYFDGRYIDAAGLMEDVVGGPEEYHVAAPLLKLARIQS